MMPLVMFTMGLQSNRSTIDSSVVYLSAYFCFGIQIDRRNDWTIKLWGPVLLQIGGYKQYFPDDLDTDDVTRCIHTLRCIRASGGSGCSSLCWIATHSSSWSSWLSLPFQHQKNFTSLQTTEPWSITAQCYVFVFAPSFQMGCGLYH